jgi:hypothetical protein
MPPKPFVFKNVLKQAKQPLSDLSAYPVLTEEVGFPPSPLSRPSGGAPSGAPDSSQLGQMAMRAIGDVLGWKPKASDTKGFLGALTQSFTLTEVEGHTEAEWQRRTYAIQSDLSGGLTGAQASIYSRGQDALDQSLPLLDGLYALDPEADAEDVVALKGVVKSQFTELVNELGFAGGPRIQRVNQYFNLLLGSPAFPLTVTANASLAPTDPDQIRGTLGNLRDELGLNFTTQDFVNSVVDEQDMSNYRVLSDYVTSLAQSWVNNLGFFGLNTATPFFGTQLVLLSRQLSVVAESVDEVRFTLDSVFIGPAERQTIELDFGNVGGPRIFLEDLLSWIHNFATEEGPRLIQDGGKFGVENTFLPVVQQLQTFVSTAPSSTTPLPPGFSTQRVLFSLGDLNDQLVALVGLATPIRHAITAQPVFGLSVLSITPSTWSRAAMPTTGVTITGTGFLYGPTSGAPTITVTNFPVSTTLKVTGFSENRLVVSVNVTGTPPAVGSYDLTVTNPDGTTATLGGAVTVTS